MELFRHSSADASGRKLRLLCVASCRCLGSILADAYWGLLDRLEQATDALLSAEEGKQLESDVWENIEKFPALAVWSASRYAASAVYGMSYRAYRDAFDCVVEASKAAGMTPQIHPHLCAILRDIFGNPFRPVVFDPAWRTSDVLLLARGIYEEKAFDRMPILADALQDAGCDCDDNPLPPRGGNLLTHLRDRNATHVRGCWALDLVLSKE
jgi:hypothetical protein